MTALEGQATSVRSSFGTGIDGSGVTRTSSPVQHFTASALGWRLIDLAVGLAFSGFLIVQLSRHAMWSDELNAWGIVLDSPSFGSLFHHMHYEGHPGLWYLLLWLASAVSSAPQAMQVVHGMIGLGIVWMVALASPFDRLEKVLILLGYFLLFEYTVVSRNYGIGLLLALAYAHERARHPDRITRNAVLLGLLANTNIFALILTAALALEYGTALFLDRRSAREWIVRLLAPAALLLLFVGFSIATVWPAADISWRTTGRPLANGMSADEILSVVTNNLSALVPIDVHAFWFDRQEAQPWGYGLLRLIILGTSPLLAVLFVRIFSREPRLLIIPAVTLIGSVAFNLCFYEGSSRHWGVNFVAFLVSLWILRASRPQKTPWALPLLGVSAAAGVLFTVQHWTIPFSNAGAAASWIKNQGLRDANLIGTPDNHAAAVAELLGRPIWFLECDCSATYLAYSSRRDDFSKVQIPERLLRAVAAQPGGRTLFLTSEPATPEQVDALASHQFDLRERARFTGGLNDRFYLYEIATKLTR